MTQTARTVLPTDLVALVSYDGRVYANEAMTLDRIGTQDSPHPLETAFEQWFSFATGRHTWISVKGPTLRGLISARKRASKLVWEIDCLINAADNDNGVLMSLLDQTTAAAGKSGALKIFARLPGDSAIAATVSRCGFAPYVREIVYRRATDSSQTFGANPDLRRRSKADSYPVFQLYNAVVPHEIRRVEAMTFAEWAGAQESLGRTSQYVQESGGRVCGLLRVAGDGDIGRFEVLGEHDALDDLIESGLAKVANRKLAYSVVPEYQEGVRVRLERAGFEAVEEYSVLARRTVRLVKAPRLAPAVVKPTMG
ncbi:MAG: hypothetical protein M3P30_00020 [Chloroflexota bacterium]|nr:hypothetical protein [Chloroflexota bacterium]